MQKSPDIKLSHKAFSPCFYPEPDRIRGENIFLENTKETNFYSLEERMQNIATLAGQFHCLSL